MINGTQHRPGRRETGAAPKTNGSNKTKVSKQEQTEVACPTLLPLPENTLVALVYDQPIADDILLEVGAQATELVFAPHPDSSQLEAFHGVVIGEQLADFLCQKYFENLRSCENQWTGPIVFGRITDSRQRKARVLHWSEVMKTEDISSTA